MRISTTTRIFESQNMKKLQKKLFNKSFDVNTGRYHLINISKKINLIPIDIDIDIDGSNNFYI